MLAKRALLRPSEEEVIGVCVVRRSNAGLKYRRTRERRSNAQRESHMSTLGSR